MDQKYKILIVDDDADIVDMYSTKFLSAGFAIDTAINGQIGLEKIKNNVYDMILLDIQMPLMDGFAVIIELKKENLLDKLKIIVLTNRGQKEDIERCVSLGVKDCAIKANFTPSEILEKVQKRLTKKKTQHGH